MKHLHVELADSEHDDEADRQESEARRDGLHGDHIVEHDQVEEARDERETTNNDEKLTDCSSADLEK